MALVRVWESQIEGARIELAVGTMNALVLVPDPVEIDFEKFSSGAKNVSFTVGAVRLESNGHVESGNCQTCGDTRSFWVVDGTGQRIELDPQSTAAPGDRIVGTLSDWTSDHMTMSDLQKAEKRTIELSESPETTN